MCWRRSLRGADQQPIHELDLGSQRLLSPPPESLSLECVLYLPFPLWELFRALSLEREGVAGNVWVVYLTEPS